MVRIKQPLNLLAYAAALLGAAPIYPFLDPFGKFLLPLALAGAVLLDRRETYPLKPLPATLLSLACFLFYLFQVSRDNLVGPAVNVLALLLALRLVTEKNSRNYLQIFVLAVFALASSSLLSLSPLFFLYLVALVVVVTVGLVLLCFHATDERLAVSGSELGKIFATALALPAVSLGLMVAFFFILPRTHRPLWNFLNPTATAKTGFSDTVQPGTFAGIAADKQVAFRVQCAKLDPTLLYWRGTVLNTLKGSTWVRRAPPEGEQSRLVGGRVVAQTVYPRPGKDRFLFTLDFPLSLAGIRNRKAPDAVFAARHPVDRRIAYRVDSRVGGELEAGGRIGRAFYLRVPARQSARVRAVAVRIAAVGSAREKIAALEKFFTGQHLTFATTDLPGGNDAVDGFLFGKKRGYCEFFASSFAVLLRLAGVPARLVGGYYGGQYNDLGGYYLVTQKDAHVWVEALAEGRWVRIDPSRLAQNAGATLGASRSASLGVGRRLLDGLDYLWNRAVITYDLGRQLQILRLAKVKLGAGLLTPSFWHGLLAVVGIAVGAAGAIWLVWWMLGVSREEKILRRFLRRVARRYGAAAVRESLGLREIAERLDDPGCREFAEIYGGAVYRDRRLTRRERRRLAEVIRRIGGRPGRTGDHA